MNIQTEKVMEFHENFNHPINDQKNHIDLKTRQLRIKLLFEELQELAEASDVRQTFVTLCESNSMGYYINQGVDEIDGDNIDKKEELDALCDLQYVLSGAILSLGFQNEFDDAFSEVHDSNMSKMCDTEDEVKDTVDHYKEQGVESHFIKKGNKFIVMRVGDNKILKNKHYKEANLTKFIK